MQKLVSLVPSNQASSANPVYAGLLDVPWPQFGWVAAALTLVVLMTIQGTGYLLPTNLWVCIQLRRPDPDLAKINRVGVQGTMQVLTIIIMARFVTGL
jgi:hypothetical protein